jgi:hypothetical protein
VAAADSSWAVESSQQVRFQELRQAVVPRVCTLVYYFAAGRIGTNITPPAERRLIAPSAFLSITINS